MIDENPKTEGEVAPEPVGDGVNAPDDRPVKNWEAEQKRKDAEIAALRASLAERNAASETKQARDPNNVRTWYDHELRELIKSKDPNLARYQDDAEDELFERKVKRHIEKEREAEHRTNADMSLKSKYPEASDPYSPLYVEMQKVMRELDLAKSPAGRLAAAEIAAARLGKGKAVAGEVDRNSEASRVRDVRQQLNDGDRSKPPEQKNSPKQVKEVANKIRTETITSAEGMKDYLDSKGITRERFFGGTRYTGRPE